jgi:hypothetical protein
LLYALEARSRWVNLCQYPNVFGETSPGRQSVKTTSYYLLLSSLASSAIAACNEDDECPHSVTLGSKNVPLTSAQACQSVGLSPTSMLPSYGVQDCKALCGYPGINECSLPAQYLSDFEMLNGPVGTLPPDAGASGNRACPTSANAMVTLYCQQVEWRGREHQGCPVAGRRPQGLVAAQRRGREEVAAYLARAAHLEAASVLAFEALARDLARLAAPAQLVAACRKAARQEVAHARTVGRLARARGAKPEPVRVRRRAQHSLLELALHNAVEGVVRESYGALQAIVGARAAAAADVRQALARIAADEAEHAALSLRIASWLDAQLSPEERLLVAQAQRTAIAELRGELDQEPAPGLRSELGIPGRGLSLRLVEALAAHVWSASS